MTRQTIALMALTLTPYDRYDETIAAIVLTTTPVFTVMRDKSPLDNSGPGSDRFVFLLNEWFFVFFFVKSCLVLTKSV